MKLADELWAVSIMEMIEDMREHDFDLKKKTLREHAADILKDRLDTLRKMSRKFEDMIREAKVNEHATALREGNRRQMRPVLQAYPGCSKDTAKQIIAQMFGD